MIKQQGHIRMNVKLLSVSAMFALCSVISTIADAQYMPAYIDQARSTCEEYGAKPGTRMFYSCMRSQVRKDQYNQTANTCQNNFQISESCQQEAAPYISSLNYMSIIAQCKNRLIARCQKNASAEYLHRNNAAKLNVRIHDYNH